MRILPFAVVGLLSLPAAALDLDLDGFYAGGNLNYIDAGVSDAQNDDTTFRSIEALAGYKYNGWLGGEIRIGIGTSDESYATATGDYEVGIDHHESLYYRAESANDVAKLYGLLGFTSAQTSIDDGTTSSSGSESGFSYGAGIGFVASEVVNVNFEYRVLLSKEDYDYSLFSIGFDYRF